MGRKKSANRHRISALMLVGLTAAAMLIGAPSPDGLFLISGSDRQEIDKIGNEISEMTQEITVSEDNCPRVLERLPAYLSRIAPLTEKLNYLEPENLARPDSRNIADLAARIQWVYSRCKVGRAEVSFRTKNSALYLR